MRLLAIALGIVAFLAVSAFVARWLTTDNAERDKVTRLLSAQARGDASGMLRELDGCRGACDARVRALATRLRRPGDVQIVLYESPTSHALGTKTGLARVVWKTPRTLTVVQCVRIRRSGNPISGLNTTLLAVSAPMGRQSDCH